MRNRHRDPARQLDGRRQRKHAVAHDVEGAGGVAKDGQLQGRDGVRLVQELNEGIEAHHRRYHPAAEISSDRVVHGRPHDGRGPQDRDDPARRSLPELSDLFLGVHLVGEERLTGGGAEGVPLREKIGVRRARAVKPCLGPKHEFAHLGMTRGDRHVHRPDAFDFMRPSGRGRGRRQERQMRDGIDLLRRENVGEAGLRRRMREVHLVRSSLFAVPVSEGRRLRVEGDDSADARVVLQAADEISPEESRGARDGHATRLRCVGGARAVRSNPSDGGSHFAARP